MGTPVEQQHFTPEDHQRFGRRLRDSLVALAELLERPGFGTGALTVGAELEMFLIDPQGTALPLSRPVLGETDDPRLTVELNRYNLEVNARPLPLEGASMTALAAELRDALNEAERAAGQHQAQLAVIGILPTLDETELGREAMTQRGRYRALSNGILSHRDAPLHVVIDGPEPLDLTWEEVTLQGANTSFQIHLRVDPRDFAASYNAAQLATAPVLAASVNSPLFLGRRLWEETRIALFSQSVDDRPREDRPWRPNRCSFGHGWVRDGIHELFHQSVSLHEALLPVVSDEDPVVAVRAGRVPALSELRLHQGTVWSWNRAIYDNAAGGHVRIELRSLPAGPTLKDMVANAAFHLGLTLALREELPWMMAALPFAYAQHNFHQAARRGLECVLMWPHPLAPSPRAEPVTALIDRLLPMAERGLSAAGVHSEDIRANLDLISNRVASRQTGARWQLAALERLERGKDRRGAIRQMLREYLDRARTGEPVHTWSLP